MNVIHSDMSSFGQEQLRWIGPSRSWLGDIISELLAKGFAFLVLHQCQIGALAKKNKHFSLDSSLQHRSRVSFNTGKLNLKEN